ncbi:MAG: endolytic transglycosylase MltG [Thiomicrospira sp.]|jgi:UPF0755 protein|nr:endolytic transglycosylase MltG [Thiomicrospira sp.]
MIESKTRALRLMISRWRLWFVGAPKRWLVLAFAPLLLVVLVGLVVLSYLEQPIAPDSEPQVVEFTRGASATAVAQRLHQAGLLKHPRAFVWYLRYHQQTQRLQSGEFLIDPHWTPAQLAEALIHGRNVAYPFTIVPGETLAQIRQRLAQQTKLQQASDQQAWLKLGQRLGIGDNLEGWLLPETYLYHKGETDVMLIERALVSMKRYLDGQWTNRAPGLPLKTPYEALILASIVEKETGAAHERQQIAGVFIRRLQKGMRLQTDPTVIYGMGAQYQGHIGRAGLDTPTPYNTYRIRGLPPTPIAMPSREAIRAALHPDDSNSLYFVAKGGGEHHFSATLEEHNRAVRRYILKPKD